MPSGLELRALCAGYGPVTVLHDIELTLEPGGIGAVLGANGAGKTTLLRAICRMVRTSGTLRLDGRSLAALATEDVARLGVAHVPEGRGTFGALTVDENLRLGAHPRRDRAAVAADLERAYGRMPILAQRRRQQAGTLSGGEQQQLAIARALMLRPRWLLLDEPSFGLAPRVVAGIFDTLRRINAEDGVGLLLVEQNAHQALQLGGQAWVLQAGRVVRSGPSAALLANAPLAGAYLGI